MDMTYSEIGRRDSLISRWHSAGNLQVKLQEHRMGPSVVPFSLKAKGKSKFSRLHFKVALKTLSDADRNTFLVP